MFSEYASRFLAQSQSRISFRQPEEPPRNPLDRRARQDQRTSRFGNGRFAQPPRTGLSSVAGSFTQFPFAARSNATPAPLFYSATDDFREEDDEAEHEREVADFYTLQRSRRQFVPQRLNESSEAEGEESQGFGAGESDGRDADERGNRPGGGIRSSWTGDKRQSKPSRTVSRLEETEEDNSYTQRSGTRGIERQSEMLDGDLGDTMRSIALDDEEPPRELMLDMAEDDDPPSIQQFRAPPKASYLPYLPQETTSQIRRDRPPPPESDTSSIPPLGAMAAEPPRHDVFWGHLYLLSLGSLFASFLLVWLHTSTRDLKDPLGDTIYTTLHASYFLLAVDTLIAIIVAFFWLAVLRSYARPLVYTILVAVPVILFSFTLYPLISSYKTTDHDNTLQDRVMRWLSTVPGFLAIIWIIGVYKGRNSFSKAIGMLEFACKILAANPPLIFLGIFTLVAIVVWTWVWMLMFTRVFLGGHFFNHLFIIDVGTWWLGVFFILVYLWTLNVISGVQRATTASTVSQWYFHRLTVPAPSPQQVARAALTHSLTALFGSICLSTFLTLVVRLPVLVLPRRFMAFVGMCSYTILPNSVAVLTHPTTLTYAAINSQPLADSARAVSQLTFMNKANGVGVNRFRGNTTVIVKASSNLPHQLALLLLYSTRLITSVTFGFGAWINTAHSLRISGTPASYTGSLYAYVVGMIAGAIGWGVLGAMEGVLTGIVDAVVVCWASEIRNGEVKYCREAGWLLGDGTEGDRDGDREGLLGR